MGFRESSFAFGECQLDCQTSKRAPVLSLQWAQPGNPGPRTILAISSGFGGPQIFSDSVPPARFPVKKCATSIAGDSDGFNSFASQVTWLKKIYLLYLRALQDDVLSGYGIVDSAGHIFKLAHVISISTCNVQLYHLHRVANFTVPYHCHLMQLLKIAILVRWFTQSKSRCSSFLVHPRVWKKKHTLW